MYTFPPQHHLRASMRLMTMDGEETSHGKNINLSNCFTVFLLLIASHQYLKKRMKRGAVKFHIVARTKRINRHTQRNQTKRRRKTKTTTTNEQNKRDKQNKDRQKKGNECEVFFHSRERECVVDAATSAFKYLLHFFLSPLCWASFVFHNMNIMYPIVRSSSGLCCTVCVHKFFRTQDELKAMESVRLMSACVCAS